MKEKTLVLRANFRVRALTMKRDRVGPVAIFAIKCFLGPQFAEIKILGSDIFRTYRTDLGAEYLNSPYGVRSSRPR